MLQNNYIIMATNDFSRYSFRDLYGKENVHVVESYLQNTKSKIKSILIKLNFSKKINFLIRTPFSWLVYKKLFNLSFSNNKRICFVFTGRDWDVYNTDYIKYLKKNYPNIKLVLYMQDLVSRNPNLDVSYAKKIFDMIISYDQGDAKKYGFYYYPTPFPKSTLKGNEGIKKSDVYFCGYAKQPERYNVILDVFEKCQEMKLDCDFYITGLPEQLKKKESNIHYDTFLSYEENLMHVANTKCILEVMQLNADGYTPRLWESIVFDKHLLTNNLSIEKSVYYSKDNIHFIEKDLSFLPELLNKKAVYSEKIKDSLSAVNFLEFIDKIIEEL